MTLIIQFPVGHISQIFLHNTSIDVAIKTFEQDFNFKLFHISLIYRMLHCDSRDTRHRCTVNNAEC